MSTTIPRLPDYVGVPAPTVVARGSRLPASAINRAAQTPRERTTSVAALAQPIPVVYGRVSIPGLLIAKGEIGTDWVLAYGLCAGEIDAVEMVQINDRNAATISGVTVTTYLGLPNQAADPTLASAIAAYTDRVRFDEGNGFRGIAYVVLRITNTADTGGFPELRAIVRGRKVFDPRSGVTAYSDNSALCMGDLITDPDYGLGVPVLGLAAAADWCDALLEDGATKRCRLGLALTKPGRLSPDLLDLMSVYAECFWEHEGEGIRLIPDQPVNLSAVPVITSWVRDSLSISCADDLDVPGEVEVIYTETRTDTNPWGVAVARRKLAGAIVPTKSTVRLDGVVTHAEADNKALSRLARARGRVAVAFSLFDDGFRYQPGDVVVLKSAARGIAALPVRIMSVALAAPGRYAIGGEGYDASHYPADAPVSQPGSLPANAIILRPDASLPDGLENFTAANGSLIVGAGGAYAQGDSGGSGWDVTFSGNTTTDGAHTTGTTTFRVGVNIGGTTTPGSGFGPLIAPTGNPSHNHSYNSGPQTISPLRRQRRLLKATSILGNVPAGCQMFGLPNVSAPGWLRDTTHGGRVLQAGATDANLGSASQTVNLTTGNESDVHNHSSQNYNNRTLGPGFGPFPTIYNSLNGGSVHNHTVALSVVAALKRRRLALFVATTDTPVVPGLIAMWEGGAIPTDWRLCDGTAGTPDMRDYFVEISATGGEGSAAGDNTVTATGTTSTRGHQHRSASGDNTQDWVFESRHHEDTVDHWHSVSATQPLDPPRYALAFIMFSP